MLGRIKLYLKNAAHLLLHSPFMLLTTITESAVARGLALVTHWSEEPLSGIDIAADGISVVIACGLGLLILIPFYTYQGTDLFQGKSHEILRRDYTKTVLLLILLPFIGAFANWLLQVDAHHIRVDLGTDFIAAFMVAFAAGITKRLYDTSLLRETHHLLHHLPIDDEKRVCQRRHDAPIKKSQLPWWQLSVLNGGYLLCYLIPCLIFTATCAGLGIGFFYAFDLVDKHFAADIIVGDLIGAAVIYLAFSLLMTAHSTYKEINLYKRKLHDKIESTLSGIGAHVLLIPLFSTLGNLIYIKNGHEIAIAAFANCIGCCIVALFVDSIKNLFDSDILHETHSALHGILRGDIDVNEAVRHYRRLSQNQSSVVPTQGEQLPSTRASTSVADVVRVSSAAPRLSDRVPVPTAPLGYEIYATSPDVHEYSNAP